MVMKFPKFPKIRMSKPDDPKPSEIVETLQLIRNDMVAFADTEKRKRATEDHIAVLEYLIEAYGSVVELEESLNEFVKQIHRAFNNQREGE